MSLWVDTFTLYKREMLIFRSNLRTNILRSVMFPIVILLFFGNLGSSITGVPVAIVNYANNMQATQFINSLQTNHDMLVSAVTTQDAAFKMLNTGTVSFVIVILQNFPSLSQSAPSIDVYYANTQYTVTGAIIPAIEAAAEKFGASVNANQPSQQNSNIQVTPISGASGSYKDYLFAAVLAMTVMFGSIFTGGTSLISDRQMGNLKTFLVAPIRKEAIIVSRIFASATTSLMYGVTTLIVGTVLGAHIAMGLLGAFVILLILMPLSIGFTSVAITLANRIKKFDVYVLASQMIILPLWFLSGSFFPTTSLPSWLYWLSVIDPVTYATTGMRDIVLTGAYPTSEIITDTIALAVFIVVFIYISIRSFKKTIE
ncbi:MAG: ABC transporter permease [Candidatus Marsarchaeota archaeon]|nr:ABC transporter permease [Candidatus Marsarchaeota archaeon]